MKISFSLFLVLLVVGCASPGSRPAESTSFFALPEVEGRVEETTSKYMSFPGPSDVWVSIVATMPGAHKGATVLLRFKSVEDPDYRLLAANRGRLFRIAAGDGRGIFSRGDIVFYSEQKRFLTLLKEEPNQTLEPTPAAGVAHL